MSKPKLITHPSLVKLVSSQSDYPLYIVKDILRALAVVLPRELNKGSKVKLEGVGTFSTRKSIKRDFVSVLTGVRTEQWTRVGLSVKPDGYMSNALNDSSVSAESNSLNPEAKTDVESTHEHTNKEPTTPAT